MATIDRSNKTVETAGDLLLGLYHNRNTLLTKIVRGINMSEGHDETGEGEIHESGHNTPEEEVNLREMERLASQYGAHSEENTQEDDGDYPASWNGPVRNPEHREPQHYYPETDGNLISSTGSGLMSQIETPRSSDDTPAQSDNERISYLQRQRWISSPFAPLIPYQYVTLGGAGGVGSWAAIIMAKMGFNNVSVYDMDNVEDVNIGGQLYPYTFVGSNKASSMVELCHMYSASIKAWETKGKFDEDSEVKPISIASFDNMEARKLMFNKWKELVQQEENRFEDAADEELALIESRYSSLSSVDKTLFNRLQEEENVLKYAFIDMRMLAELIQIIIITPDTIDEYEQYLFDDEDVEPEDCSYRATTFAGAMAGSLVGTALANVLSGRGVDTFNEFQLPIML